MGGKGSPTRYQFCIRLHRDLSGGVVGATRYTLPPIEQRGGGIRGLAMAQYCQYCSEDVKSEASTQT